MRHGLHATACAVRGCDATSQDDKSLNMESPDMKRLLLMRHGESGLGDESQSDFERTLTELGAAASKAAGAWIVSNDLAPDIALISAAQRTIQTWDTLKTVLPK